MREVAPARETAMQRSRSCSPETTGVVSVPRELLAACMTCPLCHELLRDATTISECLHSFCRKCIFEKVEEENLDCCPICNVNLYPVPLQKLRTDHKLQDLRAKIFPFKRRKVDTPEAPPSISLPITRKERSLSSLVIDTPVETQSDLTRRRSKPVAEKAATLHGPSPDTDESTKREDCNVADCVKNSSSPETLSCMSFDKNQNKSNAKSSDQKSKQEAENGGDSCMDNCDLWKPLSSLFKVSNRTKALKSSPLCPVVKAEPISDFHSKNYIAKMKASDSPPKSEVQDCKNGSTSMTPTSVKAKRLHGTIHKRKEVGTLAQAQLNPGVCKQGRRISPMWFSLISATNQQGVAKLPQISGSYLRIQDAHLPVSFIQKYLVKKLDLKSEAEVEIKCRGEPVDPTLALYNLLDLWQRTGSSQRVQASVGTSAKDFVMVLSYGRKTSAL